jgi:hypothetical protein
VVPDQRLTSGQPGQTTGNDKDESSQGGVYLDYDERATTHIPDAVQRLSIQQSASPTRAANVRIRRANCGSTLLQSPARAGYADRMRQMFEDASREDKERQLYQQLPNISRKLALSPVKRSVLQRMDASSSYRPESLCLATTLSVAEPSFSDAHVNLPHPSERSSGSWSDDSGYIITESRGGRCSFSMPPKERIYDWLSGIADSDSECDENQGETMITTEQQRQQRLGGGFEEAGGGTAGVRPVFPGTETNSNDPFVSHTEEKSVGDFIPSSLRSEESDDLLTPRNTLDVCKRPTQDPDRTPESPSKAGSTLALGQQSLATPKTKLNDDAGLADGGIRLSPLSPNVCVERGPARHHSNRKARDMSIFATPCKDRAAIPFQAGRLKENVTLKQEGIELTAKPLSPLTPRSNLMGTRFRRQQ